MTLAMRSVLGRWFVWASTMLVACIGADDAAEPGPESESSTQQSLGGAPYLVSQGRPTFQSSTYTGAGVADSSKAVDGNTNPYWGQGTFAHTLNDLAAYWYVDLGHLYPIDKIVIHSRGDTCCLAQASALHIQYSAEHARHLTPNGLATPSAASFVTIASVTGNVASGGATYSVAANNIQARYMRIQNRNTGTARPLVLGEV